ncbi:MAG: M6 family metalloprotease domain-containing protein [Anaerolineaceae bacterium]|nr:M6 family metalloprotease domain-containing protein [Anaerolineaceae bacterium]
MKKKVFIILIGMIAAVAISISMASAVSASPAAPVDHILEQPDGSTFTARQWGDEWLNGFETLGGYTIMQDTGGWWVYASEAVDGSLTPARIGTQSLKVGILSPAGLQTHIRPDLLDPTNMLSAQSVDRMANSGTQPTLVLLASFSDRAGTYTAANFSTSIFGASNSVKDFFLDASFNQLTLAAATESYGTANDGIVGWLNLGYPHPNTGSITGSANQLIVKNALIAANPYINYAAYDTNADGYISNNELHIVVVVAGYERAYTTLTPNVWAHRWNLNNVTPPVLDGKTLGDYFHNGGYAQFGEIHSDHQATIGIIAHELGHDITWPDLYDTDGTSEGVGKWSIMGAGNWNYTGSNYPGTSPSLPDAWLKWYQGWITPTVVNGTLGSAAIPQAETNSTAYLLAPNPGGVDWDFLNWSGIGEFFLVENRQLTGYDAGLPGCGLNIWHIDESVTSTNSANANEYHPLVKMMEADGLNELVLHIDRGDAGDPFPGSTVNRTFNYSSTPNSRLYSGADSKVAVTNISNCASVMTADLSYINLTSYNFLPFVVRGGPATQVLWSQGISNLDTNVYANQDFETSNDPYDIYIADDFLVPGSGWTIKEIFIPGNMFGGGTTLLNANNLVFEIYPDTLGMPSGYPGGGGALHSISLLPTDPQIALSVGLGGFLSDVTLTLSTPINLGPGAYWLVFYPEMDFAAGGQYGRHVSDTTNGYVAMVINPGGGFGFPPVWTSILDGSTWGATITQQDIAYELRGTP